MNSRGKRIKPIIVVTTTPTDGMARLYKEFGLPVSKGDAAMENPPGGRYCF